MPATYWCATEGSVVGGLRVVLSANGYGVQFMVSSRLEAVYAEIEIEQKKNLRAVVRLAEPAYAGQGWIGAARMHHFYVCRLGIAPR